MTGTLVLGKLVERRSFLFYAYLVSKKDESRVTARRERNSSVVNGALVKVARPITPITRQEPTYSMLYWCDSFTDTFLLFPGDLPPAILFFSRDFTFHRRSHVFSRGRRVSHCFVAFRWNQWYQANGTEIRCCLTDWNQLVDWSMVVQIGSIVWIVRQITKAFKHLPQNICYSS